MLDNSIFKNLNHMHNMDILFLFTIIIQHHLIPMELTCLFLIKNIKIMMKFKFRLTKKAKMVIKIKKI